MSGGDKTVSHDTQKDNIFSQTKAGMFRPELKKVGLLTGERHADGDEEDELRRPADILVCNTADLRSVIQGGTRAGKVALDVGIICPHAPSHVEAAREEVLGAAESYAREKCGRNGVERKCQEVGLVFQPMIFESTGGVSSEADKVIHCLNRAVANKTNPNTPIGEVANRFWQRVSIDLQRAMHRAFVRRVEAAGDGLPTAIERAQARAPAEP